MSRLMSNPGLDPGPEKRFMGKLMKFKRSVGQFIVVYYDLSRLSNSVLWLHKTSTSGETGQKESKNTLYYFCNFCTSKVTKIKTFLKVKCLLQIKYFLENMAYYA